MDVGDSEMNLGNSEDRNDLREILIVFDKWTRTCDMVLASLDDQIRKIMKNDVKNQ